MRKEKETNQEVIKAKKQMRITTLLIIIFVGLFVGILIGVYFNSLKLDPNRYNFDINTLVDDVEPIKIEAKTKSPQELGATKSCVLAFYTTFNYQKVEIIGNGLVVAKAPFVGNVNQTINAKTIRVGNKLFTENVSVSKYAKALNRYYVTDDNILHYSGSLSNNIVTWNTNADNISKDAIKTMAQYKERYNSTMYDYMNYIVSSKTVVTSSEVEINEDGNFVFTLTLDKSKSVVNYVKTMKDTGGLADYPDFTSDPKITLTIDKDYKILKFVSEETYNANVGISAKSTGTLTNTFKYDEDFAIPELTDTTEISN